VKSLLGVLTVAALVVVVLGESPGGPSSTTYDRWTFVGTTESYDELGRPIIQVVCEKRGRREHHPIRHGRDSTYDDVRRGDLCPTMANP
jgi:hypothetical protein